MQLGMRLTRETVDLQRHAHLFVLSSFFLLLYLNSGCDFLPPLCYLPLDVRAMSCKGRIKNGTITEWQWRMVLTLYVRNT